MMKECYYNNIKDNFKLHGELMKVNDSDKIIILCHGLHGDIHECGAFDELVRYLEMNDINSFRFDFRSSGESDGTDLDLSISGEISDLESTISYLKQNGYNEFILLGASFGAGVVSLLDVDKYNIKKIVLWYGALDYMHPCNKAFTAEGYEEAKKFGFYTRRKKNGREFKYSLKLFEEVYSLKPYEKLKSINIPILFVHGLCDETIPYEMSETISKMCKNAILKLIPSIGHCFRNSEEYRKIAIEETVNFIKYLTN